MKSANIFFIVVSMSLFGALTAFADSVSIPNTFTAGTKAMASQVNENFTAVKAAVDDNDSRIADMESIMNPSGTCYAVVSGDIFRPRVSTDGYSSGLGMGGAYITTEGSVGGLAAQAHIPDGAIITRIDFYVYDNDAVNDLKIFSWIFFVTSGGFQGMTPLTDEDAVQTSGAIAETQCLSYELPTPFTVDNSRYAIEVLAVPLTGSTWSSDLMVMGVTFDYTLGGTP